MVRGPAATSRPRTDPAQKPKLRYLAKGAVPDHGEERMSSGHRKDFGALARKSSLPFRFVTPAECVTRLGMWMEALGY